MANADNGAFMLARCARRSTLSRAGKVDAICFAPLNKAALHAGGMGHDDELHWFARVLGHHGVCSEFNVLDSALDLPRHVPRRAARGRAT